MKWTDKRQHDYLEVGVWRHLHQARVGWLVSRIAREYPDGRFRLLDVGCGDGVITSRLRRAFPDAAIHAVDLDDVRLRRAVTYCPAVGYAQSDVARLPFADASCDVVFCHHVNEHVPDDAAVLAECRRVLKPAGLFVLGIPQEDAVMGRITRAIHRRMYAEGEHVNFYTVASMRRLLSAVGFDQISHATFGMLFPYYYLHVLLVWNRITFALGHRISQSFDAAADSLMFVARRGAGPAAARAE